MLIHLPAWFEIQFIQKNFIYILGISFSDEAGGTCTPCGVSQISDFCWLVHETRGSWAGRPVFSTTWDGLARHGESVAQQPLFIPYFHRLHGVTRLISGPVSNYLFHHWKCWLFPVFPLQRSPCFLPVADSAGCLCGCRLGVPSPQNDLNRAKRNKTSPENIRTLRKYQNLLLDA